MEKPNGLVYRTRRRRQRRLSHTSHFLPTRLNSRSMQISSFEIHVAILGHVSAGKSTVLNSLLQGKFSDVAMRRTTAGVNFFRISNTVRRIPVPATSTSTASLPQQDEPAPWGHDPVNVQSASDILKKITSDNSKLRATPNIVQESTFDVELDEPICDMRPDTKLVLVDVPGLNEAGSKEISVNMSRTSGIPWIASLS